MSLLPPKHRPPILAPVRPNQGLPRDLQTISAH
uniref:Uncharacterized protein n=1 Tax=Anguilla anguilla TaxID=7936 RepID=A0A0E9SJI0_ANGAN